MAIAGTGQRLQSVPLLGTTLVEPTPNVEPNTQGPSFDHTQPSMRPGPTGEALSVIDAKDRLLCLSASCTIACNAASTVWILAPYP